MDVDHSALPLGTKRQFPQIAAEAYEIGLAGIDQLREFLSIVGAGGDPYIQSQFPRTLHAADVLPGSDDPHDRSIDLPLENLILQIADRSSASTDECHDSNGRCHDSSRSSLEVKVAGRLCGMLLPSESTLTMVSSPLVTSTISSDWKRWASTRPPISIELLPARMVRE